jgi:hypothetical protein
VTSGTSRCKKGFTKLTDIAGKLSPRIGSLEIMRIRNTIAHRPTWRDRFVEIARQVEALDARAQAVLASGLRPRARMAGFATLRRTAQPR